MEGWAKVLTVGSQVGVPQFFGKIGADVWIYEPPSNHPVHNTWLFMPHTGAMGVLG